MAQGGPKTSGSNKVANKLVAASCAAVLAVYTAGYTRTQAAANKLATQIAERRAAVPVQQRVTFQAPELRSPAPIPARLLPPSAPTPDPRREQAKTSRAEPTTANAAPSVEAAPEAAPMAPPEPLLAVAQVPTPAIAPAPTLPAAPPPAPAKPTWKDGVYTGWGYSRHGNIEAAVVIEGGRIASASISQCLTRYSCSVIDKLIPQVAQRQSPEVDYVTGATESADAFYGGVAEALSKAK